MKSKLRRIFSFLIIAAIPLVFFSCYPGGVEYYSDTDIIMTNYDDDYNFYNPDTKNYFMPDTVHYAATDPDEVNRQFEDDILDEIEKNLADHGYTRLADTMHADVFIAATVTSSTYSGVGYYPGGGWWWGGYPGWGWGGYYPGYPYYGWGYAYSYTTGTLFIEMVNPDGVDHDEEEIPIVWHAAINGLLSDNSANTAGRIASTIDQAFNQPPFALK